MGLGRDARGAYYHEFPTRLYPRLTHFGHCERGEHRDSGPHRHFGFELFAMSYGKARLDLGDGERPRSFAAGELLLIPPGLRHKFRLDHVRVAYFWLGFQVGRKVVRQGPATLFEERPGDRAGRAVPERVDACLDRIARRRWEGAVKLAGMRATEAHFAAIKRALEEPDAFQAPVIYGRILEIFARVLAGLEARLRSAPDLDPVVETVLRHLEAHPEEGDRLGDLADRVGLHESSLSRRFHKGTGETLVRYAARVRVEKAATLLAQGARVAATAEACGFRNENYFSTVFRKLMGVSPRDFQRGHGGPAPRPSAKPGARRGS